MLNYTEILEKYWGHTQFRPLQLDIIRAVVEEKQDVLALLPTGGGKSICFQVPGLILPGLCLVVSPLIALMNDQVESLVSKGIDAISLGGNLSFNEINQLLDRCMDGGTVKFLYLSPERLQSELFQQRLNQLKVGLLAIDEAHCISQWGYDFRPSYLQIAEIRKNLPQVPCIALTASATPKVQADIVDKLHLKQAKVFSKSFYRENLSLFVVNTDSKGEYLLKIVKKNPGSGLVYVGSRKETKVLAEFLTGNGIKADFYHAGLNAKERLTKQRQWIVGQIKVMVCTNAFGMGIDKPDVRFVAHWGISSSMEAYYQEAGRAGRDGLKSYAVALVNQQDLDRLERLPVEMFPEKKLVKRVYGLIGNHYQLAYGSGKEVYRKFIPNEFSKYAKLPPKTIHYCLEILKNDGWIFVTEPYFQPSRVIFRLQSNKLYEFQVFNPKFDELLKLLLRSYAGLFDEYVKIDEWMLAKKLSVTVDSLRNNLRHLSVLQVIDYQEQSDDALIAFATERLNENNFQLSKVAYEDRLKVITDQVQSIKTYCLDLSKCRFTQLCGYFGELDAKPCGSCDICLKNETNVSRENLQQKLLEVISGKKLNLKQILTIELFKIQEKEVLESLGWLIDKEVIFLDVDRCYCLK